MWRYTQSWPSSPLSQLRHVATCVGGLGTLYYLSVHQSLATNPVTGARGDRSEEDRPVMASQRAIGPAASNYHGGGGEDGSRPERSFGDCSRSSQIGQPRGGSAEPQAPPLAPTSSTVFFGHQGQAVAQQQAARGGTDTMPYHTIPYHVSVSTSEF